MLPKKERKIVLENFFSLSTLQGINYILPILFLPYLIRVLGPEKFGLLAFAQAFVQYFLIFTDYGFSLTATREIALCQDKKDKVCQIFSSVLTVKIILAGISLLILALILKFVPKFSNDWEVYVLSFGTVIGNTFFPVWFFQGTEKMRYISGLNIISGILFTLGIFIFVKGPSDYLIVPFLNSLLALIVGLAGLSIVFSKFNMGFIIQTYPDIRQKIKAGWNIFSSTLAINAYTATRVFALGILTNNTLTGYYAIAERFANIIQTFPLISFSQALYPRISRIFSKNKKKAFVLMNKIQQVTTNSFSISLPIVFISAPLIIRIVCGHNYADATLALRLLLLSIFFIGANAFKVQFLLVCGQTKNYAKIHTIMALVGLPLIFIGIYFLSFTGAAVAAVIIEGGIFILTSRRIMRIEKNLKG
jgi:PST family polysaccharide transporter